MNRIPPEENTLQGQHPSSPGDLAYYVILQAGYIVGIMQIQGKDGPLFHASAAKPDGSERWVGMATVRGQAFMILIAKLGLLPDLFREC